MNTLLARLLVLGLIVGGAGSAAAIQTASADEEETQMEEGMGGKHGMDEKVTHSVENIEDGVIITLTTDDEDALAKLQSMTEFPPHGGEADFFENVDQEINLLDNGVQITLRSEDPEVVEKLQNPPMHEGHGRGKPMFPLFGDNIERDVEVTDNGVVITISSSDADTLEKLKEFDWDKFEEGLPAPEEAASEPVVEE